MLSFSLSGAGETQTFLVWVSPCVFFLLAALAHINPYSTLSTYTQAWPRTCFFVFFFFFLRRRRSFPVRCFLVSCLVGVGGLGGCFFWSLVLVLFELLLCFCFLSWPSGAFFFLLGWWGSPCRVFPVVSPWFLSGLGARFVFLLAAFLHLASSL